jgi:hypothetical protein
MTETELMHYFDFDNADLQANRNGQLSDRQRVKLEGERRSFRNAARVSGLVIAAGSLVLLAVIIGLGMIDRSPFLEIVIPLLFVAPIGFAAYLIAGRYQGAPFAVKRLEGPVHLRPSATGSRIGTGARRYALLVDEHTFSVSPELQRVIRDGERYRVYYASDWEDILSMEPV